MKKLFTILLVLITSIGYSQTIDTVKVILPGGGSTIDTLPLSQRIDTNTVHIATNTTNIATNTSAITTLAPINNPVFTGTVKNGSDTLASKAYARSVGGSGVAYTASLPLSITSNNITADTSKAVGKLATFSDVSLKQNLIPNISDTLKYVKKQDSTVLFATPYQNSLKANDSAVVHLAGTETITGVKTFSNSPIVTNITNSAYGGSIGQSGVAFGTIWVDAIRQNSSSSSFTIGQNGFDFLKFHGSKASFASAVYIGSTTTTPSDALLQIAGGTTTYAPLKINPGIRLATTEPGAIESDTTGGGVNHLLWTDAYGTRYQLDRPLYSSLSGTIPTWNQNTTGTAANLSGTPALNNGITATTQATTDSSNLLATTAFVKTAPIKAAQITGVIDTSHLGKVVVTLKDPLQINATKDTMSIRKAYYDSLYSGAKTLQQITDSGSVTTHKITAANLNVSGIVQYINQGAAISAGLINGDVYKLPADVNGNHLLAVVDSSSAGLTFTADNTSGIDTTYTIYVGSNTTNNISINWGDGTIDNHSGSSNYTLTHHYMTSDTFNVTISSTNYPAVTQFVMNNGSYTEKLRNINTFNVFPNLTYLDINNISGLTNIDALGIPNSVNHLEITGSLTSFNRILPTSLAIFVCTYGNLTSFTATNYPSTITSFLVNSNSLTTADVNGILVGIDGAVSGAVTVNTSGQSPSAPPSGAGATAKTSLISKGGTITTD